MGEGLRTTARVPTAQLRAGSLTWSAQAPGPGSVTINLLPQLTPMKVSVHVIGLCVWICATDPSRTPGLPPVWKEEGQRLPFLLLVAASWTSQVFLKQFTSFNTNQSTFIPKRLISSKKYTPVKTFSQENYAGG